MLHWPEVPIPAEVWERDAGGEGVDGGQGVIVRLQPPLPRGRRHQALQHSGHVSVSLYKGESVAEEAEKRDILNSISCSKRLFINP